MVVPATSFTAAALNRRERRARVLNAGSPLHASLAAVPGSCRSGFSRELFSRDGHRKKLAAEAAPTGRLRMPAPLTSHAVWRARPEERRVGKGGGMKFEMRGFPY